MWIDPFFFFITHSYFEGTIKIIMCTYTTMSMFFAFLTMICYPVRVNDDDVSFM